MGGYGRLWDTISQKKKKIDKLPQPTPCRQPAHPFYRSMKQWGNNIGAFNTEVYCWYFHLRKEQALSPIRLKEGVLPLFRWQLCTESFTVREIKVKLIMRANASRTQALS